MSDDAMQDQALGQTQPRPALAKPLFPRTQLIPTPTQPQRTAPLTRPHPTATEPAPQMAPTRRLPAMRRQAAQATTSQMPLVIAPNRAPVPLAPATVKISPALLTKARLVASGALVVITLLVCVSGALLTQTSGGPNPLGVAFTAFAANSGVAQQTGFTTYRIQPGDSLESIAKRFNVTIGGIYKLNGLYLGDEITVGQALKIPTEASYGADYRPTNRPAQAAPPQPQFGGQAPGTVYGPCLFCALAGDTTGGPCAPNSSTFLGFHLKQPEYGAHWVRGFTWYHNGVDLSTSRFGTPIVAAQVGQVIFAAWDPYGGGWSVKINHCHGLATSYCHMEHLSVRLGQFVQQGQVVGLQGSTGNSTGPHVHLMVWWHNQYMDPLKFYTHLGFPYP